MTLLVLVRVLPPVTPGPSSLSHVLSFLFCLLLGFSFANSLLFVMVSSSSPQFPPLFAAGSAHSQPSSSKSEMLSISSAGSTSSIPPVIIHLISGQKVSALSFLELSSFSDSLSAQVGMVTSSSFLSGGDLSVRPSDESQKDKLLALVLIDKFQVSCSLPKFVTTQKCIIRGVPLNYPEDEILSLLENQNVTKVERLKYFKNSNFEERAFSSSVTLIFNGSIPSDVRIGLVNFRVEKFYPHPHRCKNCFHVGHLADLEGNCKNSPKHSLALCINCATSHDDSVTCNTFCINCKSSEHNSRSPNLSRNERRSPSLYRQKYSRWGSENFDGP